jgi:shikimate dehydrogenase
MRTFALIGHPLSHSFSRNYFTRKFEELGIADSHRYLNFDLSDISQLKEKLDEYTDLVGCNVTIPYKRAILPYLDRLDPAAERIGAVNTIDFRGGQRIGYNTDYLGFRGDLLAQRKRQGYTQDLAGQTALVLGTGGASRAVVVALQDLGMTSRYVSRSPGPDRLTYKEVDESVIRQSTLIVNTTPVGMYPHTEDAPDLPYASLTERHFCYDLVYNPAETRFLQLAQGAGACASNGLGMLHEQAEAAWAIWNA